ncbi:epidermal growth factor receptor kinase substrate 8-like protein 3 isoform X1 [Trematomus bernacchii]|uniref:epidermal growth factor receptor kinase substrate 8-like protein 3 isoform X1 n=1 Tax=Trematomus bernacchii TaxID=40690 RepID=UPI00146E6396|nr:epidermal growth factor receptor kinase substrate 8-like protein 3 isoform X1 [Trematomus bernacchii]XP_033994749.1 epidermal growth factor receptor kinase substrate 8-like protein 3 isoform X1 [Trematomus bernacchii]XP_033994750.1 epidermal growth factor receptor kinase substrate 8-like protein 3 isoform X1 [Trematomus bernacchii]
MFRSNSPFGNDTSSYAGSIQSNGFSNTDDVSSQASNVSKLSAMSVYLQRKEYAESVNKMMDKLRYRVEHLFTCDLDGKELRGVGDCVERLKLLDGMGRVWGQNMRLEVRGANLLLTDRETKEELESMSFSDILELKAVLDAGVFNSLLTVSVRPEGKHTTTVFMFQCEDVRADYVQSDLSAALSRRKHDLGISSNAGPIARQGMENLSNGEDFSEPKEQKPPQWTAPDYEEDDVPEPEPVVHQEEEEEEEEEDPPPRERAPSPQPSTTEEEPLSSQRPYTDLDRNVDILNHILGDIEIFMGKVSAVVAKNAKKKKKKKKGKALDGMPPAAEFEECFHKIKCGFNLVGELNGRINNPSAPEFVHSLFSILTFLVSHCPEDLLKTIVAPLLTPQCIRLLSEEASTEEDQLWQSLGDAWNIPSTQWPEDDEDIPTYTLEFSDGWQAPEVTAAPEPSEPMRREERQQPAPYQAPAKSITPAHRPKKSSRFVQSPPRDMYVTYDFISRNQRELTVRKGEVVQLLDMSKQWWKVRNSAGEEGYVPNNVLEVYGEQQMEQAPGGPPVLTKKSKPAEVKAWLEDKGFGKITVRCLGGLSGSMLLGMSREELKTVCPEEGGRVFFQLQAVKSAMSVAT